MVFSVSLSWTRILAKSVISSSVRRKASALASAVTALVSSTDLLAFNLLGAPRPLWFYAQYQMGAGAARIKNRASKGGYLRSQSCAMYLRE